MSCRIKVLTNAMALDMIKIVDGAGSGLDADLLDGLQAVDFASANHGHTGLLTTTEYNRFLNLDQEFAAIDHSHAIATVTVSGFLSATDKTKLDSIAANANNYVHPTGDGSLHVPATGTANNTKILKAGSAAGSLSWGFADWDEITNKPATFTPSTHAHDYATINDVEDTFSGMLGDAELNSLWDVNYTSFSPGHFLRAFSTGSVNPSTEWRPAFIDYSEIQNKPTTFAPSAHNQDATTITTGVFDAARIPILNQSTTGSAATLATPRTFTIGSTGKTFNGSASVEWSLTEIGVPSVSGVGATGTWGIGISGNAATATQTSQALTAGTGLISTGTFNGGTARTFSISSDVATLSSDQIFTGKNHFNRTITLRPQNSTTEGGELWLAYPGYTGAQNSSWIIDTLSESDPLAPDLRIWNLSSTNVPTIPILVKNNGEIFLSNTTNATSTTSSASIKTSGGIACAGDIYSNKISYTQSDVISFTPYFNGTGWAYSIQLGHYIREGRKVEFVIILGVSALPVTPVDLALLGMPFNAIVPNFGVNMRLSSLQNLPSNYNWTPYVASLGQQIMLEYNTGTTSVATPLTSDNCTTSSAFYLAGSYITAA